MSKGPEMVIEFTVGLAALDESLPLSVRVAVAIGKRVRRIAYEHRADPHSVLPMCFAETGNFPMPRRVPPPHNHIYFEAWEPYESEPSDGDWRALPDYAADWSAAGPLLERYGLSVRPAAGGSWSARKDEEAGPGQEYHGVIPEAAISRTVIALAADGKLKLRTC